MADIKAHEAEHGINLAAEPEAQPQASPPPADSPRSADGPRPKDGPAEETTTMV